MLIKYINIYFPLKINLIRLQTFSLPGQDSLEIKRIGEDLFKNIKKVMTVVRERSEINDINLVWQSTRATRHPT